MIWQILVVVSITGGHWAPALLYIAASLSLRPHARRVVVLHPAAPPPPATPYECAVERQRVRKFKVVIGRSR